MAATTTSRINTHYDHHNHHHHRRLRRNEFGSSPSYTRLWRLFSIATFRRRLIASIRCGGGIPDHDHDDDDDDFLDDVFQPTTTTTILKAKPPKPLPPPSPPPPSSFPTTKPESSSSSFTGKLSDLLNLPYNSITTTDPFSSAVNTTVTDPVQASNDVETEDEVVVVVAAVPAPAPAPLPEPDNDKEVSESVVVESLKLERFNEMSRAVRLLRDDNNNNKLNGAKLVRRLGKDDSEARCTMAMLGAIPPLIGMLEVVEDCDDDDELELKIEALYALLNLGIGNDRNKAAIVEAGAVHKMLNLISHSTPNTPLSSPIVANLLALTALDSNKPIIASSPTAIPFLLHTLKHHTPHPPPHPHSSQSKQDALRALYNLSLLPSTLPHLLLHSSSLIPHLISTLTDMEVSDRNLSILTNIVTNSPEGRKSISSVPDSIPVLIDVLNWVDSPACQEKASYILMVMAHRSYKDRLTMVEAGIGSALLELTLIGTTLAQKRASRVLEMLRLDKGKRIMIDGGLTLSAPICGGGEGSSKSVMMMGGDGGEVSEESKAVKELVQMSLQKNMRKIVKRANLMVEEDEDEGVEVEGFVPSEHLKALTLSSTSKSLPF